MNKIQSLDDLQRLREAVAAEKQRQASAGALTVVVSMGTCGIAAGALDTLRAVQQAVAAARLPLVRVITAGCAGLCAYEPVIEVVGPGEARTLYGHVTPEVARRIVREHVIGGAVAQAYVVEPA
jgi:NADP-reducing hydrogenase subunit HndB